MQKIFLVVGLALASTAIAQTSIPLPTYGSTFTSSLTRGYWFTAPSNCIITAIGVPNEQSQPNQVVEIIDLGTTPPPAFPGTVTGTQLFYDNTAAGGSWISGLSIQLQAGQVIGVLGACNNTLGSATSYNSYGTPAGAFTSTILGTPVTLTRFGTQSGIASNGGNQPVWTEPAGACSRVWLEIVPAAGLFASFSSDVQTGASPLTVNFTDNSFSSDPGGIQAWAWDFENDGIVDSTVQNPTHVYANCGTYDVSLQVFDASNPPATELRTGYITTDAVTADFTDQLIAPLTVAFTDTSTPTPDTWAWDLDGDGITDATTQTTAFVYPNANSVNVTLTVSRLCGPPDTITKTIVPSQQLTTGFAANNANGNFGSVMFDLDVLNPKGITITSLDVQTSTAGAVNLDMYVRQGTYNNYHLDATEWVLVGTASGTSTGGGYGVPQNLTFAVPVYLPPGLSGVKFHYRDFYCQYTTGTGVVAFGNADATMTVGTSQYTTQTNAFTGSTITPRWFAGTIYYDTYNLTGNAGYGLYGPGCAGSMGISTLTPTGNPTLGSTMTVNVDNLPVDAAIMLTGLSNSTSVLGALPFDLAAIGVPGCFLRVSPDSALFLAGTGNQATWSFAVPNTGAAAGILFFQQAVVLDPSFNAKGAVGSNAASFITGN